MLHKLIMFSALMVATLTANLNAQHKDIVDTAVAAGNFKTLVTAVQKAGLVQTLKSRGPFTVFAPTDEAFSKLPAEVISNLLKPENKSQLASILTYHVVAGKVTANDAFGLDNATTVNGQRVNLNLKGDKLKLNNATIITTDIVCSNGVIHVIDEVIIPKTDNIPATAKKAGKFQTLLAAVGAAELGEVLGSKGPFTVFAPTDEAFAKLPEGTVESLVKPENKSKLVNILKYHVVSGRVYANDAVKAKSAKTLLGGQVNVKLSADGLKINEAKVVARDLDTTNGVIHVIDQVLLPKAITPGEAVSMLENAIERGVPVFNNGHHQQCAKIYMETLQTMASRGFTRSNSHVNTLLTNTLNKCQGISCETTRSWELRTAMDTIHHQMRLMTVQR